MPVVDSVPTDRLVVLSFDDGPHPEHTALLLDVLEAADVRASFFVTGLSVTARDEGDRAPCGCRRHDALAARR